MSESTSGRSENGNSADTPATHPVADPKPDTVLPPQVLHVPLELRRVHQWVVWRKEERKGKPTKIPYNPRPSFSDGEYRRASATLSRQWSSIVQAVIAYETGKFSGVGFVFSESDPYCGIDLDKCRDPESGEIEPWALEIIKKVNSYTEVSPSGTGVKIFLRAKLPPGRKRKGKIELYDQYRYFVVTGHHLEGTPTTIEDRQAEVAALHKAVFPNEKQNRARRAKGRMSSRPPRAELLPYSPMTKSSSVLARQRMAINFAASGRATHPATNRTAKPITPCALCWHSGAAQTLVGSTNCFGRVVSVGRNGWKGRTTARRPSSRSWTVARSSIRPQRKTVRLGDSKRPTARLYRMVKRTKKSLSHHHLSLSPLLCCPK